MDEANDMTGFDGNVFLRGRCMIMGATNIMGAKDSIALGSWGSENGGPGLLLA
jgi:hypothetical protein